MQPFPSPPGPERRGRFTAIALLAAGFLVTSTIAVVQFVQLRTANERIEELEASGGTGDDGEGGLLGDLEDIFEDVFDGGFDDLLGDPGDLFEGAGDLGSLVECLGPGAAGAGEAGTTVDEIAAQVESIRELAFETDVQPRFLGDEEMTERVRELFLEDYTPKIADLEQRLLTTLGAIPPGTDLRELRADTIGEQVAGFYDTESKELVVRQAGDQVSALDRITLAHELTHALTDQALGIPLPERVELGREDQDLAALAVVEGDATLVMQQYSMTLGFDEQLQLLDPEAIAAAEAGLSEFPPYLEQELTYPYKQGLAFVCELYASGGWDAIDAAYADPPLNTSEIFFPDRYLDGPEEPVNPPNPPGPGKGWTLEARLQFGPANLLWLFSAPGGDRSRAIESPEQAIEDWRGGEVTIWSRGDQTSLSIVLAGKERWGAGLCGAAHEWYGRSFEEDSGGAAAGTSTFDGPVQDAAVVCGSGQPMTRIGIGPTLDEAIGAAALRR